MLGPRFTLIEAPCRGGQIQGTLDGIGPVIPYGT